METQFQANTQEGALLGLLEVLAGAESSFHAPTQAATTAMGHSAQTPPVDTSGPLGLQCLQAGTCGGASQVWAVRSTDTHNWGAASV